MTDNKAFWKQFKKEEAKLKTHREKAAKRKHESGLVKCCNCGVYVKRGEICQSCKKLNRG